MAVEREDTGEALRPSVWLLNASPLPTVVLDREGLVRRWNAAAERLLGWSADEMAEQGFAIIHPNDVGRHRAIVDQAVAAGTGYQSEFRVVRPDTGAVVWMEERGSS